MMIIIATLISVTIIYFVAYVTFLTDRQQMIIGTPQPNLLAPLDLNSSQDQCYCCLSHTIIADK